MGPDMVAVFYPLHYDDPSFFKTVEDLPIQKVASEGAVNDLTQAIFLKAARCADFLTAVPPVSATNTAYTPWA
jgi:hypothetical protein